MAAYRIIADGTRDFQLLAADGTALAALHYSEWFSFKAVATLADGSSFRLEPKGFWGTTIELKDQDKVLLNFKMNWDGNIIIKSRLDDGNQAFVFKSKSMRKGEYALRGRNEQELLVVKPDFQWSKLNYNYTLTSTEELEASDSKVLLLLTVLHCANYYMTMMSSAVTTIIAVS
ncbi:hypothetical protein [Hymenobacter glacieicola]|uniref:Uncharacterized protein n=1 Tax=Hymenobacter glacieicola TaxID=1562124 RepID=A0ABQ1WXC5_9BACT|nr:hypothetical protein [Hymenobacter glacieicola]GGG47792.1 hypothetical protein GCM10011378_24990 [Hymenobacter glacieicola]